MLFFFYSQLCKMMIINYDDINFYLHTTGKSKPMNNLRIYISIALFFCTYELWASNPSHTKDTATIHSVIAESMARDSHQTPKHQDLTCCQRCCKTHERSTRLHGLKLEYKGGYCGTCIRQPLWIPCCLLVTCCANLADWHANYSSKK